LVYDLIKINLRNTENFIIFFITGLKDGLSIKFTDPLSCVKLAGPTLQILSKLIWVIRAYLGQIMAAEI
jgi:hypothetical protein